MKQGMGRKPHYAMSPWLWLTPPKPTQLKDKEWSCLGDAPHEHFQYDSHENFLTFGSSALHFWIRFLPLSPVLCIRYHFLYLCAYLAPNGHFLSLEVLIINGFGRVSQGQLEVSVLMDLGTVYPILKS